jgi:hypothetical protein
VFIDIDPDKYGNNGMITQAVTKEEKQAGQLGAILGNAKIFWNDSQQQQQQQQQHQQGGEWGQPQQQQQQQQQHQQGGEWGQPQQPQQQQRQQQQYQPLPGDGFDENGVCLSCGGTNPDCPNCGIPF